MSNKLAIKRKVKSEIKTEPDEKPEKPIQEHIVRVAKRDKKKRYSVLQFNGPMKVDPGNWSKMKLTMAREDNRATTAGSSSVVQEFGEGSQYGTAAREEARRKMRGYKTREYQHDNQPWQLLVNSGNESNESKTKAYRSIREGGAGAHSDYWVFMKVNGQFQAFKIDDWYRFMPNPQIKTLDIEQAEEEFRQRDKILNQFALKAKIQEALKDQDEVSEPVSNLFPLKVKDVKDEFISDDENSVAAEEIGLGDYLSGSEGENEEGLDESAKRERKLLKKLNINKETTLTEVKPVKAVSKAKTHDSSGSDTDDPDKIENFDSVLFIPNKTQKRSSEQLVDDVAKRHKMTLQTLNLSNVPKPSASTGLNEETVRQLLRQRSMSTKELVAKLKSDFPSKSKDEIVGSLCRILNAINAQQIRRTINKKQVIYFSLPDE